MAALLDDQLLDQAIALWQNAVQCNTVMIEVVTNVQAVGALDELYQVGDLWTLGERKNEGERVDMMLAASAAMDTSNVSTMWERSTRPPKAITECPSAEKPIGRCSVLRPAPIDKLLK